MSEDKEIYMKIGNLSFNIQDYYFIVINLVLTLLLCVIYYLKKFYNQPEEVSAIVENSFTALGEGHMDQFYSPGLIQQKIQTTKKKSHKYQQSSSQAEKIPNLNELKCNTCGRSVEITYQYTMSKLNPS